MKTKNLLFAAIMICSIVMVSCNQNEPKIGGVSFTEPCLEWGKSPSYVQQQMEKKGYSVKENDNNAYIMFTSPNSLENFQYYCFDNYNSTVFILKSQHIKQQKKTSLDILVRNTLFLLTKTDLEPITQKTVLQRYILQKTMKHSRSNTTA